MSDLPKLTLPTMDPQQMHEFFTAVLKGGTTTLSGLSPDNPGWEVIHEFNHYVAKRLHTLRNPKELS